jgi:hypothetical protein
MPPALSRFRQLWSSNTATLTRLLHSFRSDGP